MLTRRLILTALFLSLSTIAGLGQQIGASLLDAEPVTASIVSEATSVAPGQPFKVAVKLVISSGWHTYSNVIAKGVAARPTKLKWDLPPGWKTDDLPWPATHETKGADGITQAYEGTVELPVQITPASDAAPGSKITLKLKVDELVCNMSVCRPTYPTATLELNIAAQAVQSGVKIADASAAPTEGMPTLLLFGFLGGLILNIMPCVFPVLGIKITSVVHQSGHDTKKVLHHGLVYTLGVLVSFWLLAGIFQALNHAGKAAGWGFQLQYPAFVFGVILVMLIFGLNMAGLFEVGTSATAVGGKLQQKSGLAGSFFSGLLATIVATPCAAPLLANALPVALALPLFPSLGFFTIIGLGLASPYLILSMAPGLLKLLPRPGPWMESFKQAMSFPMLGAAAYFVWVLAGQITEESQRDLLIGLVVVALACWIHGRWGQIYQPTGTRVKAGVATLFFLAFGIWWAWPQQKETAWAEWSPERVQTLRNEGKAVYVDFTARWCATCQVNHRIYKSEALLDNFRKHNVVLLKADWTQPNDQIGAAIAELKRAAIPVDVLYVPGRPDPIILPTALTEDSVRSALSELDKPTPKT